MKYVLGASAFLLTACAVTDPPETDPSSQEKNLHSDCPVHSPTDVQMWINAKPGPNDNPTLIATLKVTAPTPGYSFSLDEVLVKESFPPHYVFELVVTPPGNIYTQVETITDIRLEIPNFDYETIASAAVRCGKTTLFEIDPVETVY